MDNAMFSEYPDVLTVAQLQKALGIGRNTAYNLVNEGLIKSVRFGKSIRVPKLWLIDYVLSSCYTYDNKASLAPVTPKEVI